MFEIDTSWQVALKTELESDTMAGLKAFLAAEMTAGKRIYPDESLWFYAFEATPLAAVKIVILGQDPYHGEGQAHGLSFSVRPDVAVPASLINIYKELERDLGLTPPNHGYLESWARQGVLLLNSILTVEAGKPLSHKGRGWEALTDAAIRAVNIGENPVVFMLWGVEAQKKATLVDQGRHLVLKSSHPSPLSVYRGFLGCGHFSQVNEFLTERGRGPIDWSLPPKPDAP
jgi:uracil-DNA glycosylase